MVCGCIVWGDWGVLDLGVRFLICVSKRLVGLVGVGSVLEKFAGRRGKTDFEVSRIESLSCCNWSCRGAIVIGIEADCLK